MKSNFDFLERYWPALKEIGSVAESYLYSDPNACIFKLGMFSERLIQEIFAFEKLPFPTYDDSLANRIRLLKHEGLLPTNIDNMLYTLRKKRNDAAHDFLSSVDAAKPLVQIAYNVACWFMEVYGDWGFIPAPFVMPVQQAKNDYEQTIAEKEAVIQQLTQRIAEVTTAASASTQQERASRSGIVSEGMDISEAETRVMIDAQLQAVGWEADSVNLRYSKGSRPQRGRNMAIAEWPTLANCGDHGRADYVLFVGLQLLGVVEAKKANIDVASVIDYQCKEYASSIREEDHPYVVGRWGHYDVPFVFATNGRDFLEQLKEKSGIWFQDLRDATNISTALHGWFSPEGLKERYERDIREANAELENTPYDILRDPDGLNLRDYQIRAIEAAENAIIDGKQTALLSMATGTGKTRTVLGMIYRFLQTNRFKRVLFLVDRNALGDQAQDVFKEVKIADLMTLDSIYNIKELGDKDFDSETRVQVATVQSLVKRVLVPDESERTLSVSAYDLIIVDEAHRGYLLDREMSEAELLYRDQVEYVSKYRMVIDYFDAIKVALTATPALHTTQIFGAPVFEYSYREAVVDGWLIDHDAPHDIKTKLRIEGIQYKAGERIAQYNPITGTIINGAELEDDVLYEIESFNKQIIVPGFNKAVLHEIAKDLNPEGAGKTLIYAVDDLHADMIVAMLHTIYNEYGIPSDAVMKITGKAGGGSPKAVREAIKRFKNERYPNIAVTVDLLTTGIDVPAITTLVFMRRISSRILFEQMMGRATRRCDEIGKDHFEIYDPVGVYEALAPVTSMPVVTPMPSTTFEQLLSGLDILMNEDQICNQLELITAKLRRKSHVVSKRGAEMFTHMTDGYTLRSFADALRPMTAGDGKPFATQHREALIMLDHDYVHKPRGKILDYHEDELVSHTRGYGDGKAPEDYIEAFHDFISDNMNDIEAIRIVCTRPADLTRKALKDLRMELDRHAFTEQQLNSAWHDMTNQEITANIISFIRQQALGSALISQEQRVKHAFARLRQEHSFNSIQLSWLARIEKTMLEEPVLDETTFDMGAYRTQGGFRTIDKRFGGHLKDYIREINTYIYDDRSAEAQ